MEKVFINIKMFYMWAISKMVYGKEKEFYSRKILITKVNLLRAKLMDMEKSFLLSLIWKNANMKDFSKIIKLKEMD